MSANKATNIDSKLNFSKIKVSKISIDKKEVTLQFFKVVKI